MHNAFADKLRLQWTAHYSRVTGKTAASGFSFALFDSVEQLPDALWDSLNNPQDIFLSTSYLSALEKSPPENMKFKYALIYKENSPVGIAYFQILTLNHRLHKPPLRLLDSGKKNNLRDFHDKLADTATFTLLVCGNALISGEHGFSFPNIPRTAALHAIAEIAYSLRKSTLPRISVTLIKDFSVSDASTATMLTQFGFYSFNAGPNMVVPLRKNWTTFDAYLNAMKPKYRKRAQSAIKKGSELQKLNLSLSEIIQYRNDIFNLYCQVADSRGFKIFVLSPDFFIALKRNLGEKFMCEAYFFNGTMIGFTTRIFNEAFLEGYTHGVAYERTREFELYQNFLLDDVKIAISGQLPFVNMGRTSIAMKSSIGAVPKDMVCYMRFSGRLSNQLVKLLFFFIKPRSEYCRNPF